MIDKTSLVVNPQIWISESNPYKKVQFVSIRNKLIMNPSQNKSNMLSQTITKAQFFSIRNKLKTNPSQNESNLFNQTISKGSIRLNS